MISNQDRDYDTILVCQHPPTSPKVATLMRTEGGKAVSKAVKQA